MELTDFLRERLAEDEAVARAAFLEDEAPWRAEVDHEDSAGSSVMTCVNSDYVAADLRAVDAVHIARWDPARVLAEVEAKREILANYEHEDSDKMRAYRDGDTHYVDCLKEVVRFLAQPYASHQDYDQAWRM